MGRLTGIPEACAPFLTALQDLTWLSQVLANDQVNHHIDNHSKQPSQFLGQVYKQIHACCRAPGLNFQYSQNTQFPQGCRRRQGHGLATQLHFRVPAQRRRWRSLSTAQMLLHGSDTEGCGGGVGWLSHLPAWLTEKWANQAEPHWLAQDEVPLILSQQPRPSFCCRLHASLALDQLFDDSHLCRPCNYDHMPVLGTLSSSFLQISRLTGSLSYVACSH